MNIRQTLFSTKAVPKWGLVFAIVNFVMLIVNTGVLVYTMRLLRMLIVATLSLVFIVSPVNMMAWVAEPPAIKLLSSEGPPTDADYKLTAVDATGAVTIHLQWNTANGQWEDSPYKIVLQSQIVGVEPNQLLVTTNANVYSNNVLLASIPILPDTMSSEAGPAQIVNISSIVSMPQNTPQRYFRDRVELHPRPVNGPGFVINIWIVCGAVVLVVGGISVWQVVKWCDKYLGTNGVVTTNKSVIATNYPLPIS